MKVYNELFAKNLKRQLAYNDMNQTDLAKRLDITPQAVSKWCLGEKTPGSLDIFYQICGILGCTISELIGEPEDLSEGAIPLVRVEKRALTLAKAIQSKPALVPIVDELLRVPDEELTKLAIIVHMFTKEVASEET